MADSKLTALTETSVIDLDDLLYGVDVSDTTDDAAGSSRKNTIRRLLGLLNAVCQGRLTTESGAPISAADRSSQGTLYFTPYLGNKIALYDGTRWKLYAFSEISLALSGLTSGKNYDVFIYDNAGTLTIELSAAWTDDTTRADALASQDGVAVKSGAATRRWVGTVRTTGTAATEDSATKRFVWNAYNRVRRSLLKTSSSTWTYNSATIRAANADTALRVEIVTGDLSLLDLSLNVGQTICATSSTVAQYKPDIGEDSTTTGAGQIKAYNPAVHAASYGAGGLTKIRKQPTIGYHYYQWVEAVKANTGGPVSDATTDAATNGLIGTIEA